MNKYLYKKLQVFSHCNFIQDLGVTIRKWLDHHLSLHLLFLEYYSYFSYRLRDKKKFLGSLALWHNAIYPFREAEKHFVFR